MRKNGAASSLGTTELGRLIHATKGEIQGTTLQIPTIGYHTVNETTTTRAIESMITVLKKLYNVSKKS